MGQNQDWKNSPVVVAGIAVSAVVGLSVPVFKEIILPTHVSSYVNKLEIADDKNKELAKKLTLLDKEKETLVNDFKVKERILESKMNILEAENDALNSELNTLRISSVFIFGSAYPSGYGSVRIGDSPELIKKVYGDKVDDSKEGRSSLKLDGPIKDITYFHKNGEITHFSLSVDYSYQKINIVNALSSSLGQPDIIEKEYYSWKTAQGLGVFYTEFFSILVMVEGYAPIYWPEESKSDG